MTGRLSDWQLFAAVFAAFLAAEAVAAVAWHHHKTRQRRPAHHWPYDWKQDDRNRLCTGNAP